MTFKRTGEVIPQVPNPVQPPKPCQKCHQIHAGACPGTHIEERAQDVPSNRKQRA